MAPVETVTDKAALHFLDEQLRSNLATGALAMALAALVAWWVARRLLAPVQEVARATHKLASGAYDTRVVVRGHDEVTQLANDFNHLALTLQRNEQVRREYMADVSHELRTPLAVIKGQLEAIEDGVYQATPERIQALQAEVDTLAHLVSDLHELALADVGALTYRKVETDLRALVEQECTLARDACAARQQTLDTEWPTGPLRLEADPARLRQLLHNLLGNAVRYTDVGGRVQVRLHEELGQVVIDVCDSAPGVPDAVLPRLFERFFRVEGSRGRAGGGSGLGLAICRSIVLAHGGQVAARHAELGGVWIQVRLPLTARPLPSASPASPLST
jgi:two-component system sensor histidine kinase BaeS